MERQLSVHLRSGDSVTHEGERTAQEERVLRVGLIGGGFVGRAHAIAIRSLPLHAPGSLVPQLVIVAEATEDLAREASRQLDVPVAARRWEDVVENDDIDAVVVATPNRLHREIALAAAQRGKHILCEKPLGLDSREAWEMYQAAKSAGVVHMVAFNYRRVPAVRFAHDLTVRGEIGRILTFRGQYLYDGNVDPTSPLSWRHVRAEAGAGALGDVGSHVIDLARFIVGEIATVSALCRTWTSERPLSASSGLSGVVDVDDEAALLVEFENGALGVVQVSTCAPGRKNHLAFEINGQAGSILFDYESLGKLRLYRTNEPQDTRGFCTIRVGHSHPYGHLFHRNDAFGTGFTETKIVEWYDFVKAISTGSDAEPDFYDGYIANLVVDRALSAPRVAVSIAAETRL